MGNDNKAGLPIFDLYSVSELARRSRGQYKEMSILRMKLGHDPVSERFRAYMSKVLRKSEAELFGVTAPK